MLLSRREARHRTFFPKLPGIIEGLGVIGIILHSKFASRTVCAAEKVTDSVWNVRC